MNANRLLIGFIVVALLAINGGLSGLGYHGWYGTGTALAASAQEKAEAQTKFEEARANWDKIAPVISAREAREQQLLFDSLGKKLKDGAPPKDVKSTVSGMLEELREDIARELR